MRKTLLAAIIAATALVPPAALAQDRGNRGGNRERVQNNENAGGGAVREGRGNWGGGNRGGGEARPQRSGSPDGGQARSWRQPATPQAQPAAQPQAQPQQRQWRGGNDGGNRGQWRGNNGGNNGGQWRDRTPNAQPQATPQQRRDWQDRGNRGDNRGDWNNRGNRGNDNRWNNNNRNDNRGGWNNNRGGWNDRNDRGRWNNSWRSNNRYDWRGYRNGNRNHFRLPRYYAPSGWGYGYRRFGIGFTLNSILFSSQYWINDPYGYRLPEVDGPYRWVRYYNDALLVDIYTGEVVDTVYDIFW